MGGAPVLAPAAVPAVPDRPLDAQVLAAVVAAVLPDGAVLVDESLTSGFALFPATAGAPRHDVLSLTGGAIGDGLPMAVGAAVACPDRPVLAVQADGSAMYTLQALWTMAREQLDVTVLVCDNGAYAILAGELENVGAAAGGARAGRLLDLGSPSLDFVALAAGMGVPGERVTTGPELADALRRAFAAPGPHLVDAVLPRP
ncbi:thiamine pyrophosphate-dependent enzyme [Klenkia terrae]